MSSNSSTIGSNAFSSDMDESNFLKRNRALRWAQIGLSTLIVVTAVAIIPCEAVPFRHYKSTSEWASAGLVLWPQNFDIQPTIATISCGSVIAFLNIIYVVVALLPSPHSRIRVLNTSSTLAALAGFVTSLVGVLFVIYRPSSKYPTGFSKNETLYSWTCKWERSNTAPIHFARDCHATHAGFALLCLVLGLEICMAVASAVGTWLQRDVGRRREEQAQLEKLEIATKQVYRN